MFMALASMFAAVFCSAVMPARVAARPASQPRTPLAPRAARASIGPAAPKVASEVIAIVMSSTSVCPCRSSQRLLAKGSMSPSSSLLTPPVNGESPPGGMPNPPPWEPRPPVPDVANGAPGPA